jgi:hypothetical protein
MTVPKREISSFSAVYIEFREAGIKYQDTISVIFGRYGEIKFNKKAAITIAALVIIQIIFSV